MKAVEVLHFVDHEEKQLDLNHEQELYTKPLDTMLGASEPERVY